MMTISLSDNSPWFQVAENICREDGMYPNHDRRLVSDRWIMKLVDRKSVGAARCHGEALTNNVKHVWKVCPVDSDMEESYYRSDSALFFVKELIWVATHAVYHNLLDCAARLFPHDEPDSVSTNHLYVMSGKYGDFKLQVTGTKYRTKAFAFPEIEAKIITYNEEYPEGRFVRPLWMQLWQRQISGWSRGSGEPLQPYHRSNAEYDVLYNWVQSAESSVELKFGYANPIINDARLDSFPEVGPVTQSPDKDKRCGLALVLSESRESPMFVKYTMKDMSFMDSV